MEPLESILHVLGRDRRTQVSPTFSWVVLESSV